MNRPWKIWLSYGLCLAFVASAVGWLSGKALQSERAEDAARQRASLDDNIRLALWRMDSALSVFLAQENARPFQDYAAVATLDTDSPVSAITAGNELSPLLKQPPPRALVYFQIGPDEQWTSPQLPPAGLRERDMGDAARVSRFEQAQHRLDELRQKVDRACLLAAAPRPAAEDPAIPLTATAFVPELVENDAPNENPAPQQSPQAQSRARNRIDFNARSQYLSQNTANAVYLSNGQNAGQLPAPGGSGLRSPAQVGIMAPLVVAGDLLLVRQIVVQGQPTLQGCWLDWPLLKAELQATYADLLPAAELALVVGPADGDEWRLASLPVRLAPGATAPLAASGWSPVRLALFATWGALLIAAAAVAVLLRGVVALSERRADFVSAVSHELRTPLTTFRMYAEMLAAGMVPDEDRRRQYLDTLRVEADRLSHLVENVLAYARLERGGLGNRLQRVTGERLLSAAGTRLGERAEQAGLQLAIDMDAAARDTLVVADPSAVEQILFNLVDNACKYAASTGGGPLELQARARAGRFVLRVRDFGPGVPAEFQGRLFQPFHKSAAAAAGTAPGVGLGLSLSRRLARDMHGDLRFDAAVRDGAAFELTLPLAT